MEALSFSDLAPGRPVVSVRDERDRVAVAMLLDAAPEGGMFREPAPAPSPAPLWQRAAFGLLGWTPYIVVGGFFAAMALVGYRTH